MFMCIYIFIKNFLPDTKFVNNSYEPGNTIILLQLFIMDI